MESSRRDEAETKYVGRSSKSQKEIELNIRIRIWFRSKYVWRIGVLLEASSITHTGKVGSLYTP